MDSCDILSRLNAIVHDAQGVPFEEVVHFPLKERLEALLRLPAYYENCMWEINRGKPITGVVAGESI